MDNRNNIHINEKRAIKLLLHTKKVLDNNNIPFWLDSGTLLGIVRDGQLLPHNRALTLGIHAKYFKKIILLKSSFLPWYAVRFKYDLSGRKWIDSNITKIYISSLFRPKRKGIGINIVLKIKEGDSLRWVSGRACKQISSDYFTQLKSLTFAGEVFQIPDKVERYLTERYGDWSQVITDWDTNSNDGTIIDKETMLNLPRKTRKVNPIPYKKRILLTGKNLINVKKMLADTITIIEKHHIKYWLDFGTLLGIIRDNDLINWDHDADISISSDDAEKFLAIKNKFPFKYWISPRYDYSGRIPGTLRSIRIKLLSNKPLRLLRFKELHLDIFVKYKFGDYYYWIDTNTSKRIKAHYYDTLDTVNWEGRNYAIPSNVNKYLTDRYGDWKTPVEAFDSSVDDLAIYEELQYKPKTEGLFSNIIK